VRTLAALLLLLLSTGGAFGAPVAAYLTWQSDPATTMTVSWIGDGSGQEGRLLYKKAGEEKWKTAEGERLLIPQQLPYTLHRLKLKDLEPDSEYRFRLEEEGASRQFRTMPQELEGPLRFVEGGDMYHGSWEPLIATNRLAAAQNPRFALLGGDIAYAAPRFGLFSENFERWLNWLKAWDRYMVTEEGNMIPFLILIGNHDVIGRYGQIPEQAEFYYSLFPAPESSGGKAVDFGGYMSLILLDSGHTHPVPGKQTEWLKKELEKRKEVPHKFVAYHVAAYPSTRKYDNRISRKIRKHWVPLFEEHRVSAVFEHHDHAYKRTLPLYQGRFDPERGILYLGDGAWGVERPRNPYSPRARPYLARSEAKRHFLLVTIDKKGRRYEAIDGNGKTFDKISD